ncbi:DUF2306 domain-containing protein [Aurantiacibacter sp. D1-12]|uniref:DUF2306 domain-containing protein n=1 Tax=Aurantiacibacter sp. D1-12 TaxID=2993658 RepID=UPI00237C5849|nr:DUF2306 domain-containing protein [Aurantiacibacter sp. D1-12]MDE1467216.1 DUF2306 domain-containing protein [Aurantiacibacter sp. D1-12]
MTGTTANPLQYLNPYHRPAGALDLNPLIKGLVIVSGTLMTAICLIAISRAALGLSGDLPHLRHFVIMFHVTTVLPCVPLGLYLLLAPKGTAMHKQLGKLWVTLMVVTAISTVFIRPNMELTWIHIFVPLTLRASYLIIAKARRGDIKEHRNEIVGLYLGALMIPGVWAFAIEGRLMNAMLFGWQGY